MDANHPIDGRGPRMGSAARRRRGCPHSMQVKRGPHSRCSSARGNDVREGMAIRSERPFPRTSLWDGTPLGQLGLGNALDSGIAPKKDARLPLQGPPVGHGTLVGQPAIQTGICNNKCAHPDRARAAQTHHRRPADGKDDRRDRHDPEPARPEDDAVYTSPSGSADRRRRRARPPGAWSRAMPVVVNAESLRFAVAISALRRGSHQRILRAQRLGRADHPTTLSNLCGRLPRDDRCSSRNRPRGAKRIRATCSISTPASQAGRRNWMTHGRLAHRSIVGRGQRRRQRTSRPTSSPSRMDGSSSSRTFFSQSVRPDRGRRPLGVSRVGSSAQTKIAEEGLGAW